MRLGLVLEPGGEAGPLASLTRQAAAAQDAGLDLICLMPRDDGPGALAAAAALAGHTTTVRIAAVVPVGEHPVRIAEQAVVADNCTGGRLVLILRDDAGDPDLLGESVDVLLAATSARPFAHHGRRWTIPAGRPENSDPERRLRVTPAPAQIELPIWLGGGGAETVARERGLSHVAGPDQPPERAAAEWAATEERLGPAARRLRRPAIRRLDASSQGEFDDDELVAALRDEREQWGLDVSVIQLQPSLGDLARARVVDRLARRVRPRVQLDALPAGLETHWKQTLAPSEEGEMP